MSVDHVVVRGEYLVSIAVIHGFLDYRAIWKDPVNDELRTRRTNPQSLAPGDVVVIPDRQRPAFDRATDAAHRFTAGRTPVLLNLLLEDQSAEPFAARAGALRVAGTGSGGGFKVVGPLARTTGPDGSLEEKVNGTPSEGDFVMAPLAAAEPDSARTFRFLVGALEPVDTPRGLRARLNNLGYFAGFSDDDQDQLEWAVEEFQTDEGFKTKEIGLRPDRARMLPTFNRLAKRHGDMLPGEELS